MKLQCLVFIVLAIFLTSCASSNRMMRLAPSEDKDIQNKVNFDNRQVNLWPLLYRNNDFTAVCWPMIDNDAKGFAVRPFYNQEGSEYAILFPFCAWNPAHGDGWAFNTYWTPQNYGSFPIFHIGKEHSFDYIIPVWWMKKGSGWYYGIPGTCFSRKLNFVGPMWVDFDQPKAGGLFPFYYQSGKEGWFFPLYNYTSSTGETDFKLMFGALGMYYQNYTGAAPACHYRFVNAFHVSKNNDVYGGFIPLYYYQQTAKSDDSKSQRKIIATPIATYGWDMPSGETYFMNLLGPAYIQSTSKDSVFRSVMCPLYIQSKDKNSETIASLPMFWWQRSSDSMWLNILGPVYIQSQGKDDYFRSVMCPLYIQSKGKNHETISALPMFWWRQKSQENSLSILGPVYVQSQSPDECFRSVMFPLYIQSKDQEREDIGSIPLFWWQRNINTNSTWLDVLGPVYIQSQDKDKSFRSVMCPLYIQTKGPDKEKLAALPLFWWQRDRDETLFNLLGIGYIQSQSKEKEKSFQSVMFPFYINSKNKESQKLISFPMFWWERDQQETFINILGPIYTQHQKYKPAPATSWLSWPLAEYHNNDVPAMLMIEPNYLAVLGPLGFLYRSEPNDYSLWTTLLFYYGHRSYGIDQYPMLAYENDFKKKLFWQSESKSYAAFFYGNRAECKVQKPTEGDSAERILSQLEQYDRNFTSLALSQTQQWTEEHIKQMEKYQQENSTTIAELMKALNISGPPPANSAECQKLAQKVIAENFETQHYRRYIVPLIYDYKSLGNDYQWDFFWIMAESKRNGDDSQTSILKYFYRNTRSGQNTNTSVFPFLNWKSAPDRYRFSFLWRVYAYERDHDRISVHIFFLPF